MTSKETLKRAKAIPENYIRRGVDAQHLLVNGKPDEIKQEVKL